MELKNNLQNLRPEAGKKVKFGLMAKMLVSTVVPIIVCLALVGIVLLSQVQGMITELKKQDIDAQGEAAAKSEELSGQAHLMKQLTDQFVLDPRFN